MNLTPTLSTTRILGINAASRIGTKPPPPFELTGISSRGEVRLLMPGAATQFTVADRIVDRQTASSYVTDYQLEAIAFGGATSESLIWSSSNNSIATVDEYGFVTHVSDGNVVITLTVGAQSATQSLTMATTGGTTSDDTFVSYAVGSLAKHISDTVDSRLAGKSAATALKIFTSQDHITPAYVRNPNVWCADLPHVLTCLSPWNSTGGPRMAGTLVSPIHPVLAKHYQPAINSIMRFVGADGTVYDRMLIDKKSLATISGHYPDITIGLLDSPLPSENFAFAKVLPDDYADYLPTAFNAIDGRLPSLTLDQEEKGLVTDVYSEGNSTVFTIPTEPQRLAFYENKIGGDSGNPALFIINGEPVILTVWTYGGAGSGTSIRGQKAAINALMTELGGGYQLTEVDLSEFVLPPQFLKDDSVLWLDSQKLDSLTDSSGNAISIGDPVGRWGNLSTSGDYAYQTTEAQKPILTNDGLLFDGSNDYLRFNHELIPSDSNGYTAITVYNRNAGGGGTDGRNFVMETSPWWIISVNTTSGNTALQSNIYIKPTFAPLITATGYGNIQGNLYGSMTIWDRSAQSLSLHINGEVRANATAAGYGGERGDNASLIIGSFRDASNRWWSGYIKSIIIFNRVLNSTEIAQMNNYISKKYGVEMV